MNNIRFGQVFTDSLVKGNKWFNRKTLQAKGQLKSFGEYSVVAEEGFFKGHYKATFSNGKDVVTIKQKPTSYIEREIFGIGDSKMSYDSREIAQNFLASDATELFKKLADSQYQIHNSSFEP